MPEQHAQHQRHHHQHHHHHHHPRHRTEWFRFISEALPADTFHVVRFTGTEGLNRLFSFRLELVSEKTDVDAGRVLAERARFVILREDAPPAVFHGHPSKVEQGGHFGEYTSYVVELQPAFRKLADLRHSAVFLNKTPEDTARELLQSLPFFKFEHEFRLTRKYPEREFAMQYDESLFDYILFRMEEQGAYFHFAPEEDRLVFADGPESHERPTLDLAYSPPSGLDHNIREEVLHAFTLTQTPLPRQVVLRCYDWKDPKRVIVGRAEVDPEGMGDVYLAGENAESEEEAMRLAKIRAEERLCKSRLFTGVSSVPLLRPGLAFNLTNHYNPAFNRAYLVTDITHEGAQEAYISLGLGLPLGEDRNHLFYRNTFTCIPADVPYRPARTAPRANISGVLRAFVDGAANTRPEMDEHGRYKLIFPFDISGRKGGNASCWIRMAGPQTGMGAGLALPLMPGTEVLVSFIDGDPDRPVITGALGNGESGALSGRGNADFSGFRSRFGGGLFMGENGDNGIAALVGSNNSGAEYILSKKGSLSVGVQHWGMGLKSAPLGFAEATSTLKSVASGYKIRHTAGATAVGATFAAVESLLQGVAKGLDNFSTKANDIPRDGTVAGATGLAGDLVTMALPLVMIADQTATTLMSKTPPYSACLSAGKGSAETILQVKPTLVNGIMQALALCSSLGIAVSAGVAAGQEFAAAKDDKENLKQIDDCRSDLDAKQKELEKKQGELATKREQLAGKKAELEKTPDDASLRAEVETLEAAVKTLETEVATLRTDVNALRNNLDRLEKEGADLLKKRDAQGSDGDVKWTAAHNLAKGIGVPVFGSLIPQIVASVMMCISAYKLGKKMGGVSISSDENNVNIRAAEPVSVHSQTGILLETALSKKEAADWGIKPKNGHQHTDDIWSNVGEGIKEPKDKYVVVDTTTLGLFATDHAEKTKGTWVSEAPKHILKSCEKARNDRVDNDDFALEDLADLAGAVEDEEEGMDFAVVGGNEPPAPAEPNAQVIIDHESNGQITATVNDAGKIVLSRGDTKPKLELSDQGCLLVNGEHVKLTLTDSEATLTAKSDGGTLELKAGSAVLKKDEAQITCDGDGITLDAGFGEINIANLCWKDQSGTLNYKGSGPLQIDGDMIKIG